MSKPMTRAEVTANSAERLQEMRAAGIKRVKLLGCNYSPDECDAFRAKSKRSVKIEDAVALPIPGCDKEFCKCIWIAKA